MNNVLVLGNGWIGQKIAKELNADISKRYLENVEDVFAEINAHDPDIVINAIGHNGSNVDDCELDKQATMKSNVFIPIAIAEACIRYDRKMVHISSGCIFTPHDYYPINETIEPDFVDLYYSRTKIYIEKVLNWLSKSYPMLIVRLRVPLDDNPHPRNILTKLIGFNKILEAPNSITYLPDFVKALRHLILNDATGIYNIVNPGRCHYEDLYRAYFKESKQRLPKYELITPEKLGRIRTNLILSTDKLEKAGFKMTPIAQVINDCVKQYRWNELANL